MKDTFGRWAKVQPLDLDKTMDMILTGRSVETASPDNWLIPIMPPNINTLLDFGCGIGRNSFNFAHIFPNMKIVGYDNDAMLEKCQSYYDLKYTGPQPKNLVFTSNWDEVRTQKFDCIFAVLVLQHISEDDLKLYITDFKQMTNALFVLSRRFNDHGDKRSNWSILVDHGLVPVDFYVHPPLQKIEFQAEGDPNDHNIAIFKTS